MKLNRIIPQRIQGTLVCQFGNARLVRQKNGRHELMGGSPADRGAAWEWVSFFAHEIAFTPFQDRTGGGANGHDNLRSRGCPAALPARRNWPRRQRLRG